MDWSDGWCWEEAVKRSIAGARNEGDSVFWSCMRAVLSWTVRPELGYPPQGVKNWGGLQQRAARVLCCQDMCNSQGGLGRRSPGALLETSSNFWRAIASMKSSVALLASGTWYKGSCPMLWLGSCWLGVRVNLSSRMNRIVGEAEDLPHLKVFKTQWTEPWQEPCTEWEGGGDDLQMSLLTCRLWRCAWSSDLCSCCGPWGAVEMLFSYPGSGDNQKSNTLDPRGLH